MAEHPFTRRQALAAGITLRQLRGPRYRRVFQGVYVDAEVEVTHLVRCRAALAVHAPGARISHHSAASLYGLPVPSCDDIHVSVASPDLRRRMSGISSHANAGAASRLCGVDLSAPIQLYIELAGRLPMVELLALGDALVKRQRMSAERFRDLVGAHVGRGVATAVDAAAHVRAGVDSPMETRLRLLLCSAGLPEPVVNHRLRTASGHVFIRFDLSYPELRLAIEYDGRQHAESTRQWLRDINRRDWLDRHRWRLVVVTAEGIFHDPERTIERVRDALRDLGAPA